MEPDTPADAEASIRETPWVDAPAASHLKCFRLVDTSAVPGAGASTLFVTFRATTSKKTGNTRPEVTYQYNSHDHTALRNTFEKMTVASSPGDVLHTDLIGAGNKGSPV